MFLTDKLARKAFCVGGLVYTIRTMHNFGEYPKSTIFLEIKNDFYFFRVTVKVKWAVVYLLYVIVELQIYLKVKLDL